MTLSELDGLEEAVEIKLPGMQVSADKAKLFENVMISMRDPINCIVFQKWWDGTQDIDPDQVVFAYVQELRLITRMSMTVH